MPYEHPDSAARSLFGIGTCPSMGQVFFSPTSHPLRSLSSARELSASRPLEYLVVLLIPSTPSLPVPKSFSLLPPEGAAGLRGLVCLLTYVSSAELKSGAALHHYPIFARVIGQAGYHWREY